MSTSPRTAREVVELYNLVVWNERDFALAEELNAVPKPNSSPRRASSIKVAGPSPPAPASR